MSLDPSRRAVMATAGAVAIGAVIPTRAAAGNDYRTAGELMKVLADRQVSSRELVDAAIARIEAIDPKINAVVVRDFDRARAANIGLPANRRAGTTWSRVRRRPCRKRRPAHARRPRHDPPHREKIATPEIRCAKNSEPRRSIRKTAPRRTSRFGNPSAGQR